MSVNEWANALEIPEETLRSWKASAPKDRSLPSWCLEKGLIDSSAYFQWAKSHYGLPYLQSQFFTEAFDEKLWRGIQNIAPWSQELLPIAQWDGVLFVACVQPTDQLQLNFPVQMVLAEPKDLVDCWNRLHTPHAPAPVETPVLEVPILETPPPMGDSAAEDAPEGLTAALDLPTDTKSDMESPAVTSEDDIPTDPAMLAPEGIQLNPDVSKPVLQLKFDPPETPEANEAFPPPPAQAPSETPAANTPPPSDFTEITRIASSLDFLKQDFEASMIMSYENEALKPLIWDGKWRPVSEPKGPQNLTDPSAFRIVLRTKNPYLGHVVDNPINRAFFNAWGFTELPQKVLIQPIREKDHQEVLGVFVSVCNESLKNPALLAAGERHSAEILRLMKESHPNAA